MNLLREPHCDVTKGLLNPLAKPFFVSILPNLIRSVAVAFSLNLQTNAFTIKVKVILFIIRIARIALHFTALWQVQVHQLKGRYIHIRARQNEKLYGLFIDRSDQLNSKPEKEPSLRRAFTAVFLSFYQSRSTDTDVITNGHWKRINQILITQIEGLEKIRQIVEQYTQGCSQSMQPTVKSGFFKHNNALFIGHVQHGRGLITSEETGRYNGGGQHNTIRHFEFRLWFDGTMTGRFEEKIIGTGRRAKSSKLPILFQT
nr:hypothetical protein [Spirosoma pollinicola]